MLWTYFDSTALSQNKSTPANVKQFKLKLPVLEKQFMTLQQQLYKSYFQF